MYCPNVDKHVGQRKGNKTEGEGTYYWTNLDKYVGQ